MSGKPIVGLTVPSSDGPETSRWHERRAGSNTRGEDLSSTELWNHVPRGTMNEVSSFVRLDQIVQHEGKA